MTREAPAVMNGLLFIEDFAVRLSEVSCVSKTTGNKMEFPFRVYFKSGEELNVTEEVGQRLLAALAGAP